MISTPQHLLPEPCFLPALIIFCGDATLVANEFNHPVSTFQTTQTTHDAPPTRTRRVLPKVSSSKGAVGAVVLASWFTLYRTSIGQFTQLLDVLYESLYLYPLNRDQWSRLRIRKALLRLTKQDNVKKPAIDCHKVGTKQMILIRFAVSARI